MQPLINYIVPLVLSVSALWLSLQEWSAFRSESDQELSPELSKHRRVKFLRRQIGALVLFGIAGLFYTSDSQFLFMRNKAPLTPEQEKMAWACMNHFFAIIALVGTSLLLALWDVIDSLKNINLVLAASQAKELSLLQEQILLSQKEIQLKADRQQAGASPAPERNENE